VPVWIGYGLLRLNHGAILHWMIDGFAGYVRWIDAI